MTDTAFHPSTLTYWRRRLAGSGNPHRIMEAITEVVAETEVLKGKRRRALDSTVLDDAVARQDTITQLIAGIRRFGPVVPGGQELVSTHATGGVPMFFVKHWDGFSFEIVADRFWAGPNGQRGFAPAG